MKIPRIVRKILIPLFALLISFLSLSTGDLSARGKSGYRSRGYKSSGSRTYKTHTSSKSTKSSHKRSSTAKKQFLKSKGLEKVPPGYEVDHVVPLDAGGKDEPSNMQLIPKSTHKEKTKKEWKTGVIKKD